MTNTNKMSSLCVMTPTRLVTMSLGYFTIYLFCHPSLWWKVFQFSFHSCNFYPARPRAHPPLLSLGSLTLDYSVNFCCCKKNRQKCKTKVFTFRGTNTNTKYQHDKAPSIEIISIFFLLTHCLITSWLYHRIWFGSPSECQAINHITGCLHMPGVHPDSFPSLILFK